MNHRFFTLKQNLKAALTLLGAVALTAQLMASMAHAQDETDSAARQLQAILNQSVSLQGSFKQRQYDASEKLQAESSGQFKLLRPGYFSWEIESPDSQLILATPEFVWHLDRDLETLTRRPVSDSGEISPLQILGGREELLGNGFDIRKMDDQRFTITAQKTAAGSVSAGFRSLTLILNDNIISSMEIIDMLNQRIVISFHEVDNTLVLTPDDFAFTPPAGVDLFYYDE